MKRREETAIWKFGDKLMRAAIVVLIFGTAAILWVEVTGRIIHHNWTGYEEILTMTVFWLYMFGCAYCSSRGAHDGFRGLPILFDRPFGLQKEPVLSGEISGRRANVHQNGRYCGPLCRFERIIACRAHDVYHKRAREITGDPYGKEAAGILLSQNAGAGANRSGPGVLIRRLTGWG